jgi:hypothetical protein
LPIAVEVLPSPVWPGGIADYPGVAGVRSTLTQLARTTSGRSSLRRKIPVLEEAFVGRFTDHHAFLLAKMLQRVEAIEADIAEVDVADRGTHRPFCAHGQPAGRDARR